MCKDLTLSLITSYLGQPERHSGYEYEWQCPICKDTGKDNLKYNTQKNILYCFADDSHSKQILKQLSNNSQEFSMLNKINKLKDTYTEETKIITPEREQQFQQYFRTCNNNLLNDNEALQFLYSKRGLTKDTIQQVGMGIDRIQERFVIPTYQYHTHQLIGFEYRPLDLSKDGLRREKDTPTGLAEINKYTLDSEILLITEGYFDGYLLYQYLKEIDKLKEYHIVTPSNGVQGLLKQVQEIKQDNYQQIILFIDHDETSIPIRDKILKEYHNFTYIDLECGCKDFNEHYLKCIKQTKGGQQTMAPKIYKDRFGNEFYYQDGKKVFTKRAEQTNEQSGTQEQKPARSFEEFLNSKIDLYLKAIDVIVAKGLDPQDFTPFLGGWIYGFERETGAAK